MIKTHKLCVGYGHSPILSNIQLKLHSGEFTVVIGPNASGKTTLLKTLAGLLKPIAGTVFLGEDELNTLKARSRARRIAVVLTGRPDADAMLVEQVVALGRYPWTGPVHILSERDRSAVRQAMVKTGITNLQGRKICELSDGQLQRVIIARALAQEPEVLILDEPTTHLDPKSRTEIMMLLRELAHGENMTVVASTHELELAFRFADRLLLITERGVMSSENPAEIVDSEMFRQAFGFDGKLVFSPLTLSAEFRQNAAHNRPLVFVIAGGGTGAGVYRTLLRKGFNVATGVLHENDIDYHVALMLGLDVIAEKPFQNIGHTTFRKAVERLLSCDAAIYTNPPIGEYNKQNLELFQTAISNNIPTCTAREIESNGFSIETTTIKVNSITKQLL